MTETAWPLMLTVEHEKGTWSEDRGYEPPDGYAVIKLNGRVIKKIKIQYSSDVGDRDAFEQYAAEWLTGLGEEIRQLRADVAQLEIRESRR